MTSPDLAARRARGAVAAMFLTNGALLANLIPRYPELKASLELTNTVYGLTLAAFPAGALLAGLAAAALIRRLGSAPLAAIGTTLSALGLLAAAASPSAALLALALLLAGGADAVTDVAQNSHGLRVQRRYGRSIINSFHAVWSIGAVLGGSMAAAAIALDVPLPVHLGVVAIVFSLVAFGALRFALPGRDGVERDAAHEAARAAHEQDASAPAAAQRSPGRIALLLVALVLIAIGGTLVEDSGNSWATLYLGRDLGAGAAVAASGYIVMAGAQFVGRILGDGLVDRLGQRTVARGGGALTAVGMGIALAVPTVPGTIIGFACAGFGCATLVPAAMQQADDIPGLRHGTGLTVVSWLMRLGFLASPPLVGLVADSAGLRAGLLVVPLVGVMVLALAGVMPARRPVQQREELSEAA